MITDVIPEWLLFFLITGIILISVEMGYRSGKRKRDKELESPVAAIAATILGLQAFLLAFTFGIVSERYENKKGLVREDANVIRTAWARAEFLRPDDQAKSKALLTEYVEERIQTGLGHDKLAAESAARNAVKIQRELWEMAVANARLDMNSDIGALYVESVNQIAEIHALRVSVGLQARLPLGTWAVVILLLLPGMGALGYQAAISGSCRPKGAFALAFSFALVIALIGVLDNPGNALMTVSQQPMINLQSEMNASASSR